MCWTGDDTAIRKIAERDFYVYKIGNVVRDNIFVSDIRGYSYIPICPNKIVPLIAYSPCIGVYRIDEDITLINGQLQTTLIQILDVYAWVVMIRL